MSGIDDDDYGNTNGKGEDNKELPSTKKSKSIPWGLRLTRKSLN